MASRAVEKIIEAMTQLLEGFTELQDSIEEEIVEDDDIEEEGEEAPDLDSALVNEVRAALDAVIEAEDCTPEDIGNLIATLTSALEEIDPDIFEDDTEEEESSLKVAEVADDDDYALDDDDLDYDEDEDEDEEEEDDDDEDEDDDDEEEEFEDEDDDDEDDD